MTPAEAIEAAEQAEAETAYRNQLAREAYEAGRAAAAPRSYEAGYDLAYDTGYSARQDTRAYIHGILDGFAAGSQARQQFAREIRGRGDRSVRREPEPEPELEAG